MERLLLPLTLYIHGTCLRLFKNLRNQICILSKLTVDDSDTRDLRAISLIEHPVHLITKSSSLTKCLSYRSMCKLECVSPSMSLYLRGACPKFVKNLRNQICIRLKAWFIVVIIEACGLYHSFNTNFLRPPSQTVYKFLS